jgi:DNA repair protein RecN (Recombination protein N)
MLVELAVGGLGVIDATELELGPGCSALTGETGAGKTLLVAALGLLLGTKGDRALVRDGAREARVEGRFLVRAEHPARALLAEHDLTGTVTTGGEEEVVVARALGRDGRSKARVNGRLTTLGFLSQLGAALVEIAGQHEHVRIGSAAVQRTLLDTFIGPDALALASEVADAAGSAARAGRKADRLGEEEQARARELDYLAHEIAEIEAAAIVPGESDALAAEVARLEHTEAIGAAAGAALEALRGEGGISDLLEGARAEVARLAGLDPVLGTAAERLQAAAYEIDDVALELARRAAPADPHALDDVHARLDRLRRLHRKYADAGRARPDRRTDAGRARPDRTTDADSEVLAYLEEARARRGALKEAQEERSRWDAERDDALGRAAYLADRLSELRHAAAGRLARDLERALGELALEGARVEVRLERRPLFEGGTESVTFWIAANPGEALRPAAKAASGGELSRIALALYLVSAPEGPDTVVFDEVDAGVGGEAAQSVGRSLARLASRTGGQVLVVTHLPQVAAFADAHYRITKSSARGRAVARVTRVEGEERIAELSRMLAGLPESERARGHARELLELGSAP